MDLSLKNTVIVFDLDDTLYPERHYVRSGYRYLQKLLVDLYHIDIGDSLWQLFIAKHPDPIGEICLQYQLAPTLKEELVLAYRFHQPELVLDVTTANCLHYLKLRQVSIGIITDGRSLTQRLKLQALGVLSLADCVVISAEVGVAKPDPKPYQQMMQQLVAAHYVYIADNPRKDFISAKQLGWKAIGLYDEGGHNIHPHPTEINGEFAPHHWISSLSDLNWID